MLDQSNLTAKPDGEETSHDIVGDSIVCKNDALDSAEVNENPPPVSSKNNNFFARKKPKFKMPSSFMILLGIIALLVVVSWILYWSHVSVMVDGEKQVVQAAGILDVLRATLVGFSGKADLILFILVLGGFINVMFQTKALEAGIGQLIKKLRGKEIYLIPVLMLLFSIGGTTFGMAEETIPFYLIIIPIFVAAGFDVLTGFMTIMLGAGLGTAGSILNPFKIPIAVDAINTAVGSDVVSTTSGIVFRLIGYALLVALGITFVMLYARKVKNNPQKSVIYNMKKEHACFHMGFQETPEFTKKRKISLTIFCLSFVVMIFGLLNWTDFGVTAFADFQNTLVSKFPYIESTFGAIGNWGYIDMSFIFLLTSIILAIINKTGEKLFFSQFFSGAADLLSVGAIIAVASGVGVILSETNMDTTIIGILSNSLGGLNPTLFIFVTYMIFIFLSFLIPSSSGFAAAVFPIFGPVANTVGLTSGSITAFTYSSGMVNMMSPTSGIFSAASNVAKIPYDKYMKTTWPLFVSMIGMCLIILLVGSVAGSGLF